VLVVLVATLTGILTGILGLLAGLLAAALLLAGLLLAATLLVLAALTALATLLMLTALTGILRVLILWILAHCYSLQLPQPQFNRWQNKVANIDYASMYSFNHKRLKWNFFTPNTPPHDVPIVAVGHDNVGIKGRQLLKLILYARWLCGAPSVDRSH
jgi:hypothetical protein